MHVRSLARGSAWSWRIGWLGSWAWTQAATRPATSVALTALVSNDGVMRARSLAANRWCSVIFARLEVARQAGRARSRQARRQPGDHLLGAGSGQRWRRPPVPARALRARTSGFGLRAIRRHPAMPSISGWLDLTGGPASSAVPSRPSWCRECGSCCAYPALIASGPWHGTSQRHAARRWSPSRHSRHRRPGASCFGYPPGWALGQVPAIRSLAPGVPRQAPGGQRALRGRGQRQVWRLDRWQRRAAAHAAYRRLCVSWARRLCLGRSPQIRQLWAARALAVAASAPCAGRLARRRVGASGAALSLGVPSSASAKPPRSRRSTPGIRRGQRDWHL